jgi:lipopolysaccharide export system permease protein
MNTFSAYVFRQVLRPLLTILGSLVAVAILTQGLGQLDMFISNRQAMLAFVGVTLLTLPNDVALVLPFATFFAVLVALNRMRGESEIAVAYSAGLSPRRIASPIVKLAVLVALANLAINAVLQPISYREMREIYYSVQADVATSLVREGSFTYPSPGLTLYARERGAGGEMRDLMIDDARGPQAVTYTARSGAIVLINGAPSMVMRDGQVQRQKDDGSVDLLDFDRYVLQLGLHFDEPGALYLKSSDRFLSELFFPDVTQYYDQRNVKVFLAEAYNRLGSPLLNIALAYIAIAGALGGYASRRGYGFRLVITSVIGLSVRLIDFLLQSASVSRPQLNAVQILFPLAVMFIAYLVIGGRSLSGKMRRINRNAGPTPLRASSREGALV